MSGLRHLSFVSCVALALGALTGGCDIPNPGIAPTPATLNFPIALALSDPRLGADGATSSYLIVASSDYDARYNQGSLFSLDLGRIVQAFEDVRTFGRGRCTNPAAWYDENVECQIGDAATYLVSEVWIDSFTSGLERSPQGDRFYLSNRTQADLTWVDIDNGTGALDCEQGQGAYLCAPRRRTTRVETGCPSRDVTLTGDPTGLVVMDMASLVSPAPSAARDVVVMFQRNGTAALYLDSPVGGLPREPVRTHILTGLPSDVVNARLEPSSGLAWLNSASPVSTRATRLVARVGVYIDPNLEACSAAFPAQSVVLDGIATGFDTRDTAFVGNPRFAYVLSRSPESILTIDQNGTPFVPGAAAIHDVDSVNFGPSRLHPITIGGRGYLVASAFDGRGLSVIGTEPTELVAAIPGFDGPYELVVDQERGLVIVADFRTSVLRFVDLSPLADGHPPVVLGRVATPRTHVGFP
ncbi:MAG: hypothetical protein U0234_02900 [Sandaracinus sp.]